VAFYLTIIVEDTRESKGIERDNSRWIGGFAGADPSLGQQCQERVKMSGNHRKKSPLIIVDPSFYNAFCT
jgi:hypothetical protein